MTKKRGLTLAGLAVCLAVLGLIWFTVSRSAGGQKETLTDLTADRIGAMELTLADGTRARLERTDGVWTFDGTPAPDQLKISKIAAALTGVAVTRELTGDADPAEYGITAASPRISITDTEGETSEITVGSQNGTTLDVYCALDSRPGVIFAVSPGILDAVGLTRPELADEED